MQFEGEPNEGLAAFGAAALACGGGGGGGDAPPQQTCETPGGQLARGSYLVENNTYNNTQVSLPAHPITSFTQCATLPTSLHLDMAGFLADGVERGLILPTWWVASIETAAIVEQGTGGFGLDDYQVKFRAK